MKCKECGELYGNMKDDGVIVNPILGELCGDCWGKTQPSLTSKEVKSSFGYANCTKDDEVGK